MPSDKFSYMLDDQNNKKNISDLALLGLDENYFDTNLESQFNAHLKVLYREFHPDKNEHSERSTEAFKHLCTAIGKIKDNLKRNHGAYVHNSESGIEVAAFDFHHTFGDLDKLADFLAENVEVMQHLKFKAQILQKNLPSALTLVPQTGAVIPITQQKHLQTARVTDSVGEISQYTELAQVIAKFNQMYRFAMVTSDLIDAQHETFEELEKLARTGSDFYLLAMVQKQNRGLGSAQGANLLKAATLGFIPAIRQLAGYALLGCYRPLEQSIRWTLDTLNTLQIQVIPRLAASTDEADQDTLNSLNIELPRTIERVGLAPEQNIPLKGTAEYEQLVSKLVTKLAKEISIPIQFPWHVSAEELLNRNGTEDFYQPLSDEPIREPAVTIIPEDKPLNQAPIQTPVKESAEGLLAKLKEIGEKPDLNLVQKKGQAVAIVAEIVSKIESNKELLKLSKLISQKNSPAFAYLREERDFWRFNKYGNTNTWNILLGKIKTQMDANVELCSEEKYSQEEYKQFMTIMNEHRGRGFGPVTHSKLYRQLNDIPESEIESISIIKNP
jgi:hypothetical protein